MSASATVSLGELRKFGLSVGVMLALLFGLFFPWLLDGAWPWWPWAIAVPLAVTGLILPSALRWPHRGWMAIAAALGYVNTRIILALLYFLVFTPMGLFMRLLGRRDAMLRRREPESASYRRPSETRPARHMERPF